MSNLNANQRRALAALLSTATIKAAAKKCGLCERTLYNYLDDDDFRAELRSRQDRAISAAVAALSGLAGDAVKALKKTLTDADASPSARVRAALGILEQVRNLSTFAQLEDRIIELEARLASLDHSAQGGDQ